jgi:site-specific recombinase XerD
MASLDLVDAYLAHLLERGCTDRTLDSYDYTLGKADHDLEHGLELANETELRAWIWRKGLKPSTRATYFGAIAGFYRWCAEVGHFDFDPTARIPRPKVPPGRPRAAREDQARRILTESAEPYRLWARLAAYANLRCIEISRLHREHVTATTVTVHRGKGNKSRIIHTHPIVWAAVYPLPPGPITTFGAQEISNRFKKVCDRLGMPGLSMHRLRGWYATQGYRATKDIRAVGQSMGHANPGTTAGYIDIADDQLQAVVNGLPVYE